MIRWFGETFERCCAVVYEMCGLEWVERDFFEHVQGMSAERWVSRDTFGKVMKRNLAVGRLVSPRYTVLAWDQVGLADERGGIGEQTRHLSLPGSEPFPDPQSQAARFLSPDLGSEVFHRSGAKNLWEIRESVIGEDELRR